MTKRCPWGDSDSALMRDYHDNEWGKPCRDERRLFEMLILEGAQAGLSWNTVLNKREAYKVAFDNFDLAKVAAYDENKIAELLENPGIIRNRLKIRSAVTNAQLTLQLGSLADFIWGYVDGQPVVNAWERQEQMPATSPLSDRISKDMRKLGFKFVGSTIIYSYLQAIGVINDHLICCDFRGTGDA
jgi:DNA-3-methyladenine glycosylase I